MRQTLRHPPVAISPPPSRYLRAEKGTSPVAMFCPLREPLLRIADRMQTEIYWAYSEGVCQS